MGNGNKEKGDKEIRNFLLLDSFLVPLSPFLTPILFGTSGQGLRKV
jgi:hypothetical protein